MRSIKDKKTSINLNQFKLSSFSVNKVDWTWMRFDLFICDHYSPAIGLFMLCNPPRWTILKDFLLILLF